MPQHREASWDHDEDLVTSDDRDGDVTAEPVSPLVALRRHWVVGAVLVVAGTVVGALVGAVMPATYTAEARVAVGSNDLQALSVPGYVYAAQQLAASTARYVDNNQALGVLRDVAGDDVSTVTASPIPESNIIRVEVSAGDEGAAVSGAAALTDYLIEQSSAVNSSSDQEELLQQYTEIAQQAAQASVLRDQAAAVLQRTRTLGVPAGTAQEDLVARESELSVLQTRQEALSMAYQNAVTSDELSYQLVTVAEAAPSYDNVSSQVQRYGLLGLVAGLLLALVASVLLERRGRPRAGDVGSGDDDVDQGFLPDEASDDVEARHADGSEVLSSGPR